jgi:hypothetical protein
VIVEIAYGAAIGIGLLIVYGTVFGRLFGATAKSGVLQIFSAAFTLFLISEHTTASFELLISTTATIVLIIFVSMAKGYAESKRISRALDGEYSDAAQWTMELIQEDDELQRAFEELPDIEVKEVQIIAESKDELRELMIDRHEEHIND